MMSFRHSPALGIGLAFLFGAGTAAAATEVEFVGQMGNRAVLQIDGGRPRIVAVGATTPEGVKLLTVEGSRAVVEMGGRREQIRLGGGALRASTGGGDGGGGDVVLYADSRGHFLTVGAINGAAMRFLVDTGASLVSLGSEDALRAGIDYHRGAQGTSMTAAGPVRVWRVHLDAVKIGPVTLHNVEAAVHDQPMPIVLLGMSALNRFEMRRQGETLTLQRHY